MISQPARRFRFWQLMVAGAAFVLSIFLLSGTNYARQGIEHIVRMVATSRVEDWATHLSEKHGHIFRQFGKRPLPDAEVAELRREAEIYGIEAFRIYSRSEPLGKVRLYARNTFDDAHRRMAIAAFSQVKGAASDGAVTVRAPLRDASGHAIGSIVAMVDQKRLHHELTQAMQHILVSAVLALFIILLVALFLFRRLQSDAQLRISHAREVDELTGLPNQAAFDSAIEMLMRNVRQGGNRALACLIFGIDDLGRITCAEGHEAASHVLRTLAGRFARLAHEGKAQIFRLERDDFAVLLSAPFPGRHEARTFADGLLKEAQRPVYWRGKSLLQTLSIGISFHPEQAATRSELMRQATLMRQAARDAGGNTMRLYSAEMDRDYHEMASLERLLRKAARNCASYFSLHYQPIVRLEDERLHGFEVLLRMDDDDGNPISPAQFIPVAERLNLMDEIGAFVLAEACATAAQWPAHLHVSVNLSPLQFRSGKLPASVWQALETSGLHPRRLELEVTESIMMQEWDMVHAQLEEVRKCGARIVLDDFGTGYSSMSYLWKFNFDKLKIDRSFTQATSTCEEARSILRSLVIMARSLKLPVVVEGIETAEQAAFLRKFRCDFGQGYYFGKPMPATDVAALIMRDWQQRRAREAGEHVDATDIARQSAAL